MTAHIATWTDQTVDEFLQNWPDCAVVGCFNKCCLSLDSIYCWPHTTTARGPDDDNNSNRAIDAVLARAVERE